MAELSVISVSTVIRGNVGGSGSLRIEGKVKGNVEVSGDLSVGAEAEIDGDLTAATITVAGAVQGDLNGTDAVLLESSARVVGNLVATRIGIAEGALVRGTVQTDGAAARAPSAAGSRVKAQAPKSRPVAPVTSVARAPAPSVKKAEPKVAAEEQKKRKPPAPVVAAPRKGARGKKKTARRT